MHLSYQILLALLELVFTILDKLLIAINSLSGYPRLFTGLCPITSLHLVWIRRYGPLLLVIWILGPQLIKVVMLQSLTSCDSRMRVHIEHLNHQIYLLIVHHGCVS